MRQHHSAIAFYQGAINALARDKAMREKLEAQLHAEEELSHDLLLLQVGAFTCPSVGTP